MQHFLPSGPFAMLPLTRGGSLGHRSAIVWSERRETVSHMLALDPDFLLEEIERRFGLELGEIALETPVEAFPLEFGIARSFVAERLALVGDAAHVIHPIAGQGLNLGLKDAAVLAEEIVAAVRLGMDPGAAERARALPAAARSRPERTGEWASFTERASTDLFSNDVPPCAQCCATSGSASIDRKPATKRFFSARRAGVP